MMDRISWTLLGLTVLALAAAVTGVSPGSVLEAAGSKCVIEPGPVLRTDVYLDSAQVSGGMLASITGGYDYTLTIGARNINTTLVGTALGNSSRSFERELLAGETTDVTFDGLPCEELPLTIEYRPASSSTVATTETRVLGQKVAGGSQD